MDGIQVEFIKSATQPEGYPPSDLPDLAVAGRSNVGKSSVINCLVARKKLARVSQTPGFTRLINFFRVDDWFYLVDLPGYGYARRSLQERGEWKTMVETYLAHRQTLVAMLVLIDLRRGPQQEELLLLDTLQHYGIRAVAVLTKSDKLAKNKRKLVGRQIGTNLAALAESSLLFSSKTGEGRTTLWNEIERLIPPITS